MPSPLPVQPVPGNATLKDAGDSNMKRSGWKQVAKAPTSFSLTARICKKRRVRPLRQILYNQGQVCIAGTRLLLEESIADEFLACKTAGAKLAAGPSA